MENKLSFKALTSRGLEDVLVNEIETLGLTIQERKGSSVTFSTNWAGVCKALLQLRSATRVVWPLIDFSIRNYDDILHKALRGVAFEEFFNVRQSFKVLASTSDPEFSKQPLIAMKLKDAIADRFRSISGERPSVEKDDPEVQWLILVQKGRAFISLDLSGESLTFRGYRKLQGAASLKEHLAAGLLKLTGWDHKKTLIDPMCGSGTFIIEAALSLSKHSSQMKWRNFAIENLKIFQPKIWERERERAFSDQSLIEKPPVLIGFDQDPQMIKIARANADRAGVSSLVDFRVGRAEDWSPPNSEPGLLVCNPPYGKRLGDTEEVRELYYQFGRRLKSVASGWQLWLLSGDAEATQGIQMKASQRYTVYNAEIEARWLRYDLR